MVILNCNRLVALWPLLALLKVQIALYHAHLSALASDMSLESDHLMRYDSSRIRTTTLCPFIPDTRRTEGPHAFSEKLRASVELSKMGVKVCWPLPRTTGLLSLTNMATCEFHNMTSNKYLHHDTCTNCQWRGVGGRRPLSSLLAPATMTEPLDIWCFRPWGNVQSKAKVLIHSQSFCSRRLVTIRIRQSRLFSICGS